MIWVKNIIVSIDKKVVTLTISRPEAMNALTSELLSELSTALREIADHPEYRCLIVKGAGDKAFVAGADISEMQNFNARQAFDFSLFGNRVFAQLEQLHIPTIAVVNGYALGGGMELAIACDIRIATSKAKFALPETGLGIIPGFGGTFRLARLIGEGQAKHLMYTGKAIDGEEAYRIGLVELLATAETLDEVLADTVANICKNSPAALRQLSRLFAFAHADATAADFLQEAERFGACFTLPDQKERMQAFTDRHRKS